MRLVARLGGFLGCKCDGKRGVKTIWVGCIGSWSTRQGASSTRSWKMMDELCGVEWGKEWGKSYV